MILWIGSNRLVISVPGATLGRPMTVSRARPKMSVAPCVSLSVIDGAPPRPAPSAGAMMVVFSSTVFSSARSGDEGPVRMPSASAPC